MKSACVEVGIWCLLVISSLAGIGRGDENVTTVGPSNSYFRLLTAADMRLAVLAGKRDILRQGRLDEKRGFTDEKAYEAEKSKAFSEAARIIPSLFGEEPRTHFSHVSVCPGDQRVFFLQEGRDMTLVGYVPISMSTDEIFDAKIGLVLIPNLTTETPFAQIWRERTPYQRLEGLLPGILRLEKVNDSGLVTNIRDDGVSWARWIQRLLQESLGRVVDPVLIVTRQEQDILYARGLLRTGKPTEGADNQHDVEVWASDRAICVKISFLSEGQKTRPAAFTGRRHPYSYRKNLVPSFWPPEVAGPRVPSKP